MDDKFPSWNADGEPSHRVAYNTSSEWQEMANTNDFSAHCAEATSNRSYGESSRDFLHPVWPQMHENMGPDLKTVNLPVRDGSSYMYSASKTFSTDCDGITSGIAADSIQYSYPPVIQHSTRPDMGAVSEDYVRGEERTDQEIESSTSFNWTSVIKEALEMSNGMELEHDLSADSSRIPVVYEETHIGTRRTEYKKDHFNRADYRINVHKIDKREETNSQNSSNICLSDGSNIPPVTSNQDVHQRITIQDATPSADSTFMNGSGLKKRAGEEREVSKMSSRPCLLPSLSSVRFNKEQENLDEVLPKVSTASAFNNENGENTLSLAVPLVGQILQHSSNGRSKGHAHSLEDVRSGKCMGSQIDICEEYSFKDNNAILPTNVGSEPSNDFKLPVSQHFLSKYNLQNKKLNRTSSEHSTTSVSKLEDLVNNLHKVIPPAPMFKGTEPFQTQMDNSNENVIESEDSKLPPSPERSLKDSLTAESGTAEEEAGYNSKTVAVRKKVVKKQKKPINKRVSDVFSHAEKLGHSCSIQATRKMEHHESPASQVSLAKQKDLVSNEMLSTSGENTPNSSKKYVTDYHSHSDSEQFQKERRRRKNTKSCVEENVVEENTESTSTSQPITDKKHEQPQLRENMPQLSKDLGNSTNNTLVLSKTPNVHVDVASPAVISGNVSMAQNLQNALKRPQRTIKAEESGTTEQDSSWEQSSDKTSKSKIRKRVKVACENTETSHYSSNVLSLEKEGLNESETPATNIQQCTKKMQKKAKKRNIVPEKENGHIVISSCSESAESSESPNTKIHLQEDQLLGTFNVTPDAKQHCGNVTLAENELCNTEQNDKGQGGIGSQTLLDNVVLNNEHCLLRSTPTARQARKKTLRLNDGPAFSQHSLPYETPSSCMDRPSVAQMRAPDANKKSKTQTPKSGRKNYQKTKDDSAVNDNSTAASSVTETGDTIEFSAENTPKQSRKKTGSVVENSSTLTLGPTGFQKEDCLSESELNKTAPKAESSEKPKRIGTESSKMKRSNDVTGNVEEFSSCDRGDKPIDCISISEYSCSRTQKTAKKSKKRNQSKVKNENELLDSALKCQSLSPNEALSLTLPEEVSNPVHHVNTRSKNCMKESLHKNEESSSEHQTDPQDAITECNVTDSMKKNSRTKNMTKLKKENGLISENQNHGQSLQNHIFQTNMSDLCQEVLKTPDLPLDLQDDGIMKTLEENSGGQKTKQVKKKAKKSQKKTKTSAVSNADSCSEILPPRDLKNTLTVVSEMKTEPEKGAVTTTADITDSLKTMSSQEAASTQDLVKTNAAKNVNIEPDSNSQDCSKIILCEKADLVKGESHKDHSSELAECEPETDDHNSIKSPAIKTKRAVCRPKKKTLNEMGKLAQTLQTTSEQLTSPDLQEISQNADSGNVIKTEEKAEKTQTKTSIKSFRRSSRVQKNNSFLSDIVKTCSSDNLVPSDLCTSPVKHEQPALSPPPVTTDTEDSKKSTSDCSSTGKNSSRCRRPPKKDTKSALLVQATSLSEDVKKEPVSSEPTLISSKINATPYEPIITKKNVSKKRTQNKSVDLQHSTSSSSAAHEIAVTAPTKLTVRPCRKRELLKLANSSEIENAAIEKEISSPVNLVNLPPTVAHAGERRRNSKMQLTNLNVSSLRHSRRLTKGIPGKVENSEELDPGTVSDIKIDSQEDSSQETQQKDIEKPLMQSRRRSVQSKPNIIEPLSKKSSCEVTDSCQLPVGHVEKYEKTNEDKKKETQTETHIRPMRKRKLDNEITVQDQMAKNLKTESNKKCKTSKQNLNLSIQDAPSLQEETSKTERLLDCSEDSLKTEKLDVNGNANISENQENKLGVAVVGADATLDTSLSGAQVIGKAISPQHSHVQKVDGFSQCSYGDLIAPLNKTSCAVEDAVKSVKMQRRPKSVGEKCITCKYCGQFFRHVSAYTIHLRIHTGEKPYTCKCCGKNFAHLSKLKFHKKVHTQPAISLQCPCCSKTFAQKKHLISHFKIHIQELKNTERSKNVQRKSNTVNPLKSQGPICNIYDDNFASKFMMKVHMHGRENPLSCVACGKNFVKFSHLVAHERTHWPVKPYACSICGKGFKKLRALKRHSQGHSGDTPFSCLHCGEAFCDLSALRLHQISKLCIVKKRLHEENSEIEGFLVSQGVDGQVNTPKFFKCQLCKQLCPKWCQYTLHLQTHTKTSPYLCFACGQSYEKDSGFSVHCKVCCQSSGEEASCSASLSEICGSGSDLQNSQDDPCSVQPSKTKTSSFTTANYIQENCQSNNNKVHSAKELTPQLSNVEKASSLPETIHQPNGDDQLSHNLYSNPSLHASSVSGASSKDFLECLEISPSLGRFKCPRCDQRFKQHRALYTHIQTHAPGFRYVCGHCGQSFERWNRLWLHQRIHRVKGRCYSCSHCNLQFRFFGSYKEHMFHHAGERLSACPLCPLTFVHEEGLHAHQCEVHQVSKILQCDVCAKSFSSLRNLIKHSLLHNGTISHQCLPCNLSFTNSKILKNHLETHNKSLVLPLPGIPSEPLSFPHKCKRCKASFSTGDLLYAHQICHLRDSKKDSPTLVTESTSSTSERPHPCTESTLPTKRPLISTFNLNVHPHDKSLYNYPHPDKLYVTPALSRVRVQMINLDSENEEILQSSNTGCGSSNISMSTMPESAQGPSESDTSQLPQAVESPESACIQSQATECLLAPHTDAESSNVQDKEDLNCLSEPHMFVETTVVLDGSVSTEDTEYQENFECADCSEQLNTLAGLHEHYFLHAVGNRHLHINKIFL